MSSWQNSFFKYPKNKKTYLVVLYSLGNFHGDRKQLVKATDKRISYGVEDELMT